MKAIILTLLTLCTFRNAEANETPKRNLAHSKKTTIVVGTGANAINASQAPYQVVMDMLTISNRGGGAILNSEWILTASHIATYQPQTIRAGVSNVTTSQGQTATALKFFKFLDGGSGDNPPNDIALIRLSPTTPLNLTGQDVKAIRLASRANTSYWDAGASLVVSGFGVNVYSPNSTTYSTLLRRAEVKAITSVANIDVNKIDCLGPTNTGNDACNGDSGGPLVSLGTANINTSTGPNGPLVGIVSSGLGGSVTGGNCGQGGRYMKVAQYVEWIYKTILEETTPNVVCGSVTFTKPNVEVDGMGYYEWSTTTPSLLTISDKKSPNPVYNSVSNASGEGNITLKLYKDSTRVFTIETITKKVWVGRPGLITFVTDGTFSYASSPPNITICRNRGYCMNVVSETMLPLYNDRYNGLVAGSKVVSSFSWSTAPSGMYRDLSTTTTNPSTIQVSNNKVCFGANTTGTFLLTVTANGTGTCGTNSKTVFIQANNCGFRVAPNPAQGSLTVIFDNPEMKESVAQQLDLLDEKSGKVVKTMKKPDKEDNVLKKDESSVTMDVLDLPRGTYYLHLTFGDKKVEKVRIILN